MSIRFMVTVALLSGCLGTDDSDGSGNGEALLVDLSASQLAQLCERRTPQTVTCADGTELTTAPVQDCVKLYEALPATCDATLQQAEACFDAVNDDPCLTLDDEPGPCAALDGCIPNGDGSSNAGEVCFAEADCSGRGPCLPSTAGEAKSGVCVPAFDECIALGACIPVAIAYCQAVQDCGSVQAGAVPPEYADFNECVAQECAGPALNLTADECSADAPIGCP